MKLIKLMVCILAALSITACVYEEGDDVAQASFSLMTTQEKAMHDKVYDQFGQKSLRAVRDAVGKRSLKPDEHSVPFIDVANVIKHCNENILIPEDFKSGTDPIKKATRAKFSNQDQNWYRKILKVASGEDYEIKQPVIKEETVEIRFDDINEKEERVVVNENDLLPLEAYRDVKQMARGCEGAINVVESAASQDRPLTLKDASDIKYERSICETKKLNENL